MKTAKQLRRGQKSEARGTRTSNQSVPSWTQTISKPKSSERDLFQETTTFRSVPNKHGGTRPQMKALLSASIATCWLGCYAC